MLCSMKRLHLTPEEKLQPEREHALKENGKERDRLKAILYPSHLKMRTIQVLGVENYH